MFPKTLPHAWHCAILSRSFRVSHLDERHRLAISPDSRPIFLLAPAIPRRLTGVQPAFECIGNPFGIAAVKAGSLFEELFIEHYPRLVRTLLRLTGNRAHAEELASDAFCRLYQRGPVHENAPAWLYRTAINLALDALRANSRRLRREELVTREQVRTESHPADPLNELLSEERRRRVRDVIARLKPVEGQLLLMASSDFSSREIASVIGVKPESISTLLGRAKERFEKKYTHLYGSEA
jgi:RNA polymerase sigma factor (sigma-70 family)